MRLVCQQTSGDFHHVLILEQASSESLNDITYEDTTTDGSVIADPEITVINSVPFRLRVYNASLVPGVRMEEEIAEELNRTEEEAIEELLSREASRDMNGRSMDYTGEGFNLWGQINFDSTAPYHFTKGVTISMDDYAGCMETNHGATSYSGDGLYGCMEPVLVPEMVEEEGG